MKSIHREPNRVPNRQQIAQNLSKSNLHMCIIDLLNLQCTLGEGKSGNKTVVTCGNNFKEMEIYCGCFCPFFFDTLMPWILLRCVLLEETNYGFAIL